MKLLTILADIFLNFTLPLPKTLYDEIKILKDKHLSVNRPVVKKSIARLSGAIGGGILGLLLLVPSAASETMNRALFNNNSLTEIFPKDWLATGNPIGIYTGDIFLGLLVLAATTILGRTVCSVFMYGAIGDKKVGREILSGLEDGVLGAITVRTIRNYRADTVVAPYFTSMLTPHKKNNHRTDTATLSAPSNIITTDLPNSPSGSVMEPSTSFNEILKNLNMDSVYLASPPTGWLDGPHPQKEVEPIKDAETTAASMTRDNSDDSEDDPYSSEEIEGGFHFYSSSSSPLP